MIVKVLCICYYICLCVCSVEGGVLVSVLYDYSQHGDPAIRSLLLHILSQVSGCGVVVGGVNTYRKVWPRTTICATMCVAKVAPQQVIAVKHCLTSHL